MFVTKWYTSDPKLSMFIVALFSFKNSCTNTTKRMIQWRTNKATTPSTSDLRISHLTDFDRDLVVTAVADTPKVKTTVKTVVPRPVYTFEVQELEEVTSATVKSVIKKANKHYKLPRNNEPRNTAPRNSNSRNDEPRKKKTRNKKIHKQETHNKNSSHKGAGNKKARNLVTVAKPFNALQHVCRLFRAETKHLELKYNAVTFTHNTGKDFAPEDCGSPFFDFINSVPPATMQLVNKIIIRAAARSDEEFNLVDNPLHKQLPIFVDFCKRNPRIEMRYVFPTFSYHNYQKSEYRDKRVREVLGDWQFVIKGSIIAQAVTGRDHLELRANYHGEFRHFFDPEYDAWQWGRHGNLKQLLKGVKNFAFFPAEDSLDRTFRRRASQFGEETVQYAEKWITHGISGA
ncbi:hypothetical protein BDV95DRAFT_594484 [Massariosphaeria phaeospora]|uniref:Uncharacterized protein n=1 Tax=Massariosphaeria phaeospora TaxID=100035 RepID=A0A7C8MNQ1_9PLEO|nr:hypothetical protein BDV95DRAFT_594484 [Massariosphaeria phaeospora]